ncbi:recombinase RecT [Acinetobacter ursingii]|uniref:recombinase RecT n=1 Tax=Acinetobacter ursingii TaxID=108980 RepID=UPI0027E4CF75|nr:recombinase RecT [Acinetobacter ursingii]
MHTNLLPHELIIDNFAGGGGTSTGLEQAFGRPVDVAINHDPKALAMHRANHPETKHYCESVWDIDPVEVTGNQPVGLVWLSPDCKHFSKAKGGGITPVVGIDGWARIINDNPVCDGIQFEQDDESCTCKIYRKDRSHPTVVTEYLSECQGTSEPWKKYPKRMLRHKALIQCARVAFGFSGIYDEDEARRIDDCQTSQVKTVTSDIPDGYQEFEDEHLPTLNRESQYGSERLKSAYEALPHGSHKNHLWAKHSVNLKGIAQFADQALSNQGETYEHSPA